MKTDFQTALKALGKQARQKAQAESVQEQTGKSPQEDEVDFAKEVGKVRPLKSSQRYQAPPDGKPLKPRPKQAEILTDDYLYVGSGPVSWEQPPVAFSKNGQGENDIRRLRSGHYPVVADVDLHGYTQEEAQQVLNEFIGFVKKRGVCAEIVHGSGLGSAGYKPVLKNMTRRWLMQHPDVLAYTEPRPGNDGAVRILLKRNRRGDDAE